MWLHLRPLNPILIRVCSLRNYATSSGFEGATSDPKAVDNRTEIGDDGSAGLMTSVGHEVMHTQCTQQPTHGPGIRHVREVMVSHHSKSKSGVLPLLPHVPVGSRLHTLMLETRRLKHALLPDNFKENEDDHHVGKSLSKSPVESIRGLCWTSDILELEENTQKSELESEIQSEGPNLKVKNKSLDNARCLDQLLMENCLHPVSYTTDDILLHETKTMTPNEIGSWKSYNHVQNETFPSKVDLKICTKSDVNFPWETGRDTLKDFKITRETTPITVIPFESVTDTNKDKLHIDAGIAWLEKSCVITCKTSQNFSLPPLVEQSQVVEYLCSGKMSSDMEAPESDPPLKNLLEMEKKIEKEFKNFFVKMHEYNLYQKDVIFENNYWGEEKVYRGLNAYAWQLNKIKMGAHFKFSNVKFHILKITHHEEDNSVKVRWRINGLPALTSFLKFWKFFPGQYWSTLDKESEWHDGFSIFYLGKDGLIQKHRIDKWMLDEDRVVTKKTGLAATLAVLIGLLPRTGLGDLNSFMMTGKKTPLPPT